MPGKNKIIMKKTEIKEINSSSHGPRCERKGDCCRSFPGWFGPGEVEKAAGHLTMNVDAFVRKYIIIDGVLVKGHGWVNVFAPIRLNKHGEPALPPLSRVDFFYRYFKGPCIFYKDNGCMIYPSRPIECRYYFCGQTPEKNLSHEEKARIVALLWRVAYADGRLDKYEDSLVLKISDLLHVSRGLVMRLKHDAQTS